MVDESQPEIFTAALPPRVIQLVPIGSKGGGEVLYCLTDAGKVYRLAPFADEEAQVKKALWRWVRVGKEFVE